MIYILKLGRRKTVINSFHGINIWNHISKNIPIDVSYACFKMVSKKYLQSNIIPYRIT